MQKKAEKRGEIFIRGLGLRTFVSVAFLVIAGTLFSILFFVKGRQIEYQGANAHFTAAACARISLLEKEIEFHAEHIESVAAFYNESVKVERAEFREFVKGPLAKHPDIVAFLWIPRVASEQRDQY